MLYYALRVSGSTKLPMPADQNTMDNLLANVKTIAANLGIRTDLMDNALMGNNAVDWTTKIGFFRLLCGSDEGYGGPVLVDTTTGLIYSAPSVVTRSNIHCYNIVNNWSRPWATLSDGVHEFLCAAYVQSAQPLRPPEPAATTPRPRSTAQSPMSGEAPLRRPLLRSAKRRKQS